MDLSRRRSLTGGGGEETGTRMVGVVKKIERAPNGGEQRVRVKTEGSGDAAIYVPKKYARDLKSEHKYTFHIEDDPFRGGGNSRFAGVEMARRTHTEPTEVSKSKLGGFSNRSFSRG